MTAQNSHARHARPPIAHMPRSIEPEWLDELPADDPRAMRSRRDLRRINALMMNRALITGELRRAFPAQPPRTITEIGAGDGSFMLAIAQRLAPQWLAVDITMMDRQSLVTDATRASFASLGWRAQALATDVFDGLAQPAAPIVDVIVANLFLHHFEAADLRRLLALVAPCCRVLIACEPRRSGRALLGSRLLGLIGCNDVSRHDAQVSVRAGFADQELSRLWPAGPGWTLRESAYGLFSHGFVATRDGGGARAGSAGKT